jgi:hypothetical protein
LCRRLETRTWKSNEAKNAGRVVKYQSTFDRLMSSIRKRRLILYMNQPLKKESQHLLSKKSHLSRLWCHT